MKNNDSTNVLICGVGGKGIILASKLLSEAALLAGLDVKQSEVHGMSQRGGSVVSYVRFGGKIYSPLIEHSSADFIVGFEKMEILRYLDYANLETVFITADLQINPSTVNSGKFDYPKNIAELLAKHNFNKVHIVDIFGLAESIGNVKTINTIMLGILSNYLKFSGDIWTTTLKNVIPSKILDINLKAFELGRNLSL